MNPKNCKIIEEVWKPVAGYEGLYEVSNLGGVKSLPKVVDLGRAKQNRVEKFLRPIPDGKGYLMVWMFKNQVKKMWKVHRLVADAFIPNPYNKPQVDHINTIKDDNRVCNLIWCTEKENSNNPISYKRNSESKFGCKNHHARSVIQLSLDGTPIKTWDCINDVKRELGFSHSHISQCCSGKRNVAYGFIWKYANNG